MGKKTRDHRHQKDSKLSRTLPPSPSHSLSSSSSSDFEFTISLSPRKSSTTLCPADELFYKGQLLPLHLSPRLSMVRTLLASSSTSSSSEATASRDSTGSSTDSHSSFNSEIVLLSADCDSSRPSSVTDLDDELRRLNNLNNKDPIYPALIHNQIKKNKYFSLSRFSSVFKKEPKNINNREGDGSVQAGSHVKRISSTAKEVIRKYLKKVKPLYEKISQKQQQQQKMGKSTVSLSTKLERSGKEEELSSGKRASAKESGINGFSHSFSGNLRYPRRKICVSSCPSSMRSSPSHSGVLYGSGFPGTSRAGGGIANTSSMEELHSAIQGAIAHCKNSMNQSKSTVSNEI